MVDNDKYNGSSGPFSDMPLQSAGVADDTTFVITFQMVFLILNNEDTRGKRIPKECGTLEPF